ncbi:MAG: MATE family efflux transporter [Oscillospiraceae bacterium]|nr:MATE family efflux transporter [Oscillospiraceae bacterium]
MKKDMTQGREAKLIFFFTLPIMAANLLQQLYNTTDNVIVGQYVNDTAFAAVASTSSLTFLYIALAMGLSVGCSVVVSQLFGAKQMAKLNSAIDTSLILLAVFGVAMMGIFLALTPFMLNNILNVPAENGLYALSKQYMLIYCIGLPFQFVYNAIASILRGVGDSKSPLIFLLITTLLNVALDLWFVIGFHWGVVGTAIATVIAQGVCVVISYIYLRRKFPFIRGAQHFDPALCKTLLKIGLPTAIQQSVVAIGNMGLQRLVNSFGETVMSAYGAGVRITNFVFIPILGFQQGLASFTGQNIGANRFDRVRRGFHATLVMGIAATAIVCVTMYLAAHQILQVFGIAQSAVEIGIVMVRFYAKVYIFFTIYMILGGVLQGAGDTVLQSIATLTALALRVVLAYLGARVFFWYGPNAAWETNLYGWVAAAIITYTRYLTGGWKKKAIVRASGHGALPADAPELPDEPVPVVQSAQLAEESQADNADNI